MSTVQGSEPLAARRSARASVVWTSETASLRFPTAFQALSPNEDANASRPPNLATTSGCRHPRALDTVLQAGKQIQSSTAALYMSVVEVLNSFEAPVSCFKRGSTGAKATAEQFGPLDAVEVKGPRTTGLIVFYCQVRDTGRSG